MKSYPQTLHHGAIAGAAGSCIQLRIHAEHCLLVDCGLFQAAYVSPESGAGGDNLAIGFSQTGIKGLVAAHVYIDHVGRIPYLLAADFKGPILCSEPSAKLLSIVLEDTFTLGFDRDQQQVWRYLELFGLRIISLSYDTWFALADVAQPAIVIAAGRMCAGGRNVDYLKAMLHDPQHDVLLAGYQTKGELSPAIQADGSSDGYVLLGEVRYNIGAKISGVFGCSVYADQQGLLNFVTQIDECPSETRIVHGDAAAKKYPDDSLLGAIPAERLPSRVVNTWPNWLAPQQFAVKFALGKPTVNPRTVACS